MRKLSTHAEWLRLVEVSGPFISTTMLERAFPQGLESIDTPRRQRLRSAYEEWRDAVDENDPQLTELHREWVRLVLEDILDYDREVLVGRDDFGSAYVCRAPECAVNFVPDLAVIAAGDEHPRLFISIQPPDMDLEKVQANDGWPVPAVERMTLLCRTAGVRLGIVTNGERWMLVNAPVGSTSSHISWYSRLWFQEPITLKAFLSLLGVRRCFGPTEETLDALLEESLKHHEEVTDTLGEQVRRAVEVLVQCLDKADQDRNRELLHDVSPAELYEAGLTMMMRLVFVLCAEERGLLLLGDPVYDQYYAISTLRGQLAEDADLLGPEVLDRRHDAWARLLAVFRAIYDGIDHESLRIPALGGSLFDPDRFPFLEGRAKGTKWREAASAPLPIDNRTVLLLLEALQLLEQTGGALLLSYKALDVENIGHVYEGLLENTVFRVSEVTLGLFGSQKAKNPNASLRELETARTAGKSEFINLILEKTQRSEPAIRNALAKSVDEALTGKILTVCGGDTELTQRILPFANLLRTDAWGDPIIYRSHSFMVAIGADRRETGTHYTPKSLTETVVAITLEPLVFFGPNEGKPREEWRLKSPEELLDLKICDPAMGSGAFLVQTCRWLAEHLVEAWMEIERKGKYLTVNGDIVINLNGDEPMPTTVDDRLLIARRLVTERCLYGVDLNPLAVELAKLSIWLITMAKGRPFGFLDHNLRHGDSLLGIHQLDQLTRLNINPEAGHQQLRIFGQNIEIAVREANELRNQIRFTPIRDIRDVEAMKGLDQEVRMKLESVELIADAMIGETLRCVGNARALDSALNGLATIAGDYLNGIKNMGDRIASQAITALSIDLPEGKPPRKPFHWALEFPEVFVKGGFDGIVGNPPFMGGKKISGNLGSTYREFIVKHIASGTKGNADLCAFFFLRCCNLLGKNSCYGLIATSSMAEGETREVGLDNLKSLNCSIYSAESSRPWPGKANVTYSSIWITTHNWNGIYLLNGKAVNAISPYLKDEMKISGKPFKLLSNKNKSFIGSFIYGQGFVLTKEEAQIIIEKNGKNSEVIFPYLIGQDFNSHPNQSPQSWVINFSDMKLEEAENYEDCIDIVRLKVKPERDILTDKGYREKWWQYGRRAVALYKEIYKFKRVLFHSFTSKYTAFGFVPTDIVYAAPHVVFAFDDYTHFSILQSVIHECWVREYTSYSLSLARYTPSDCFETFPFPTDISSPIVKDVGEHFYCRRQNFMEKFSEGLVSLYNRFNNPKESNDEIKELRLIYVMLNKEVAKLYGLENLNFECDFRETKDGIRYTISKDSRLEVLQQLLQLNHDRHEDECKGRVDTKASQKVVRNAPLENSSQVGLNLDGSSQF